MDLKENMVLKGILYKEEICADICRICAISGKTSNIILKKSGQMDIINFMRMCAIIINISKTLQSLQSFQSFNPYLR